MLQDAVKRTVAIAEPTGVRALSTHLTDEEASRFYQRFGFEASPVRERSCCCSSRTHADCCRASQFHCRQAPQAVDERVAGKLLPTFPERIPHREHAGKTHVQIVDFVDAGHPALMRMWSKRQVGYRAMGYRVEAVAADLFVADD